MTLQYQGQGERQCSKYAKGGFAAVEQYLPNMPIFERGLEIHFSDRPHSLQTPNQQRQAKP